jgi:hypothetical protein
MKLTRLHFSAATLAALTTLSLLGCGGGGTPNPTPDSGEVNLTFANAQNLTATLPPYSGGQTDLYAVRQTVAGVTSIEASYLQIVSNTSRNFRVSVARRGGVTPGTYEVISPSSQYSDRESYAFVTYEEDRSNPNVSEDFVASGGTVEVTAVSTTEIRLTLRGIKPMKFGSDPEQSFTVSGTIRTPVEEAL